MKSEIRPQVPRARCYQCGSMIIHAICHHCGKPMCKGHTIGKTPQRLGFLRALAVRIDLMDDPETKHWGYESPPRASLLSELFASLRIGVICNSEYDDFRHPGYIDRGIIDVQRLRFPKSYPTLRYISGLKNEAPINMHPERKTPEEQYHCKWCAHAILRIPMFSFTNFVLALILLLAGVMSVFSIRWLIYGISLPIPLVYIDDPLLLVTLIPLELFSLFLFVLFLVTSININHSYWLIQKNSIPPVPIEGRIEQVSVSETCSGNIRLDKNGRYLPNKGEISGLLRIPLTFSRVDLIRYQSYLRKARDSGLKDVYSKEFVPGFLLFGRAFWSLNAEPIWAPGTQNILRLTVPHRTGPIPWLIEHPEQTERANPIEYDYRVTEQQMGRSSGSDIPFQVILSMQPDSNRQAFRLELEFTGKPNQRVSKVTMEKLDLWVPTELGSIVRLIPEGRIHPEAENRPDNPGFWQRVAWKNIVLSSQMAFREEISFQFRDPIPAQGRLLGELIVKVPTTLSGLEQVDLYSPWGTRREVTLKAETRLSLSLDLDLAHLRHQWSEIIDAEVPGTGVTPGSKLIARLVNCLSQEGFYVKRILENPPQTSQESAQMSKRFWDLIGRKYEGVYPVDFHLVLIGEENSTLHHENGSGQVKVQVNIQGAVTDDEMRKKVQTVKERLIKLVKESLN